MTTHAYCSHTFVHTHHCIVVVVILLHSQITIKKNNFALVRMSSCLNDFYVVFCSARIDNDESDSSIFGTFSHQQKALNDSVYPIFDKWAKYVFAFVLTMRPKRKEKRRWLSENRIFLHLIQFLCHWHKGTANLFVIPLIPSRLYNFIFCSLPNSLSTKPTKQRTNEFLWHIHFIRIRFCLPSRPPCRSVHKCNSKRNFPLFW